MNITEYAESTKYIYALFVLSIVFIFVFILSPLKNFQIVSFLGKIITLFLLAYIIYYNIILTNNFTTNNNIYFITGEWSPIKTTLMGNYVLSFFLVLLILTIVRNLF